MRVFAQRNVVMQALVLAVAVRLLPAQRSLSIQLPIDGGHGVGVDADAVRRAQWSVRGAPADGRLAARHLRALLGAADLDPLALHVVTPHSAPTLSNGILSPYKHLICNETFIRLRTPTHRNNTHRVNPRIGHGGFS